MTPSTPTNGSTENKLNTVRKKKSRPRRKSNLSRKTRVAQRVKLKRAKETPEMRQARNQRVKQQQQARRAAEDPETAASRRRQSARRNKQRLETKRQAEKRARFHAILDAIESKDMDNRKSKQYIENLKQAIFDQIEGEESETESMETLVAIKTEPCENDVDNIEANNMPVQ